MNIITTNDEDGIPEGSVLYECVEAIYDGEKYWEGMWSSMAGTYMKAVKQSNATLFEDE
jgi:hypothetical protein